MKLIKIVAATIALYAWALLLIPVVLGTIDKQTWLLLMILFFIIFIAVVEYARYMKEP